MELRTYVQVVIRKWWIILLLSTITILATYVMSKQEIPIYESTTTFVMRPRLSETAAEKKEFVEAVDTLSRRIEINTTYAEVAKSQIVKENAIERLNLSSTERKGLSTSSKVVPSTNVLEITARGPDPVIVRDFADAVSVETRTYISNLYDIFELEPLDRANLPTNPINANMTLNVTVGAILGLLLGVTVAFLTENLLDNKEVSPAFDIIDHESGMYNEAYLRHRLQQEMSRSKRNKYELSLALMKVTGFTTNGMLSNIPEQTWREIVILIGSKLRDEDVLTRFNDTTFALLLPDTPGQVADKLLNELRVAVTLMPLNTRKNGFIPLTLRAVAGIASYVDYRLEMDEFLAHTVHALRQADVATYGAVQLLTDQTRENGSVALLTNGATTTQSDPSMRKVN